MITFYKTSDAYGCFSNFSRHPVNIYGRQWMTSEHPFQAMKFHPHHPDRVDVVAEAKTPGEAARLGRDPNFGIRVDWDSRPGMAYGEDMRLRVPQVSQPDDQINRRSLQAEPLFTRVKDVFMYEVVLAKFSQHGHLKEILLGTDNEVLVEATENDPYWAWGPSFIGENKLGRILMAVRACLRTISH